MNLQDDDTEIQLGKVYRGNVHGLSIVCFL